MFGNVLSVFFFAWRDTLNKVNWELAGSYIIPIRVNWKMSFISMCLLITGLLSFTC